MVFLSVAGLAVGGCLAIASFAHADAGPSVTVAVHNGSNAVVTSAPIGTALSASTTVATSTSSIAPTGTVNFNLFANTTCAGIPTTQSGVALVNATAQSATTTMPASGLSYTVNYSGDASNTASVSQCVIVTPTSANVTIATTLSTTTAVLTGSSIFDHATLSGVTSAASGTVSYKVYTDNACTQNAQNAGTVTVASGVVPNSSTFLFTTAGTYYWQAVYSGDSQNAAATSTCGSEVLTVTTTPVTPPAGTGTISGTVFNDLNSDYVLTAGEPGIAGFTINLHSGTSNSGAVVATVTANASGGYSFTNLAFGTYYVEEVHMSGWQQTTPDASVTVSSVSPAGVLNFANASSTSKTTKSPKGHAYGYWRNFFNKHFTFFGHKGDDDGSQVTQPVMPPAPQQTNNRHTEKHHDGHQ